MSVWKKRISRCEKCRCCASFPNFTRSRQPWCTEWPHVHCFPYPILQLINGGFKNSKSCLDFWTSSSKSFGKNFSGAQTPKKMFSQSRSASNPHVKRCFFHILKYDVCWNGYNAGVGLVCHCGRCMISNCHSQTSASLDFKCIGTKRIELSTAGMFRFTRPLDRTSEFHPMPCRAQHTTLRTPNLLCTSRTHPPTSEVKTHLARRRVKATGGGASKSALS